MFRTYVMKERAGSDIAAALKALMTGEPQTSQAGRMFAFEEIESDFMEEKSSVKIPFSDIEDSEELPDIIGKLEEYASYRESSHRRHSDISEEEQERRDNILDEIMNDVQDVFEGYLEDRNQPYEEFEEEIPDVPEEIVDQELREEIREVKELIESRKEAIVTLDIDPLSLVELYRVPSENSAVAGSDYSFEKNGETYRYQGVNEERIQPLVDTLVSAVDVPVNTSQRIHLFSRLPDDEYMTEAAEIVREYEEEFEETIE